jgi:hypothetical protein
MKSILLLLTLGGFVALAESSSEIHLNQEYSCSCIEANEEQNIGIVDGPLDQALKWAINRKNITLQRPCLAEEVRCSPYLRAHSKSLISRPEIELKRISAKIEWCLMSYEGMAT